MVCGVCRVRVGFNIEGGGVAGIANGITGSVLLILCFVGEKIH